MFGDFPMLAAVNNARELVRPTFGGGRRGGLPAHVNAFTVEELQAYWSRYYKPRNAIVVLSGAIDPTVARERITAHFAKLPPGEKVPAPRKPRPAKLSRKITELKVRSPLPDAESTACLAYAAPQPGSDLYAPFLVLVARLYAGAGKLGADGPSGSPVFFALAMEPCRRLNDGETGRKRCRRIHGLSRSWPRRSNRSWDFSNASTAANQQFSFLLGLVEVPDTILANNPYGVAFSLGRRDQLDMTSTALKRAWDAITDDQLRRVVREVFAPERRSG